MDIFTKRGITPDVVTIRRYRRFETPADIHAADWRWQLFPENLNKWCGKNGSPGWVMPKYIVPGSQLQNPLAQLRPDNAIRGSSYGHDHDGMDHVEKDCPCGIRRHNERFLSRERPRLPLAPFERERHERGKRHVDEHNKPLPDPDTGADIPLVGPHRHVRFAKYLLPPGPHGKRLDRHPMTDFRAHHDRVFFVLEGTLKNDALVSRGEASFNVPSVTLWQSGKFAGLERFLSNDAPINDPDLSSYQKGMKQAFLELEPWDLPPELEVLARDYLRGTPVVIVCDSDWHHNAEVAMQALVCRDKLAEYDCPAMVAAPPEGAVLYERDGEQIRQKVGNDDFLGRDNGYPDGDPDDLLIVDPQPGPGFTDFVRDYTRHAKKNGRKADSVIFDIDFARWLIVHSAAKGYVKRPVTTVARAFGMTNRTIYNATNRLRDFGAIEMDELPMLSDARFIRVPGKRRALPLGPGYEGRTPTIKLRADLKPTAQPDLRVGDWLSTL